MAIFQHGAKNMQVFSRHKEHLAEARQGTDDENDKQARQARRTAQNTASNKEQDDNNDTEPAQPRRTGKRSQPMTAKAQLLQTAANDKDYCAATSGELEQAWKRSKRARYHAQQLKGVHSSPYAACCMLVISDRRSLIADHQFTTRHQRLFVTSAIIDRCRPLISPRRSSVQHQFQAPEFSRRVDETLSLSISMR